MVVIEAKDFAKYYEETCVVNQVNFSIEREEIVGIIGTSGSGKSTILRALSGLDAQYEGQLYQEEQHPSVVFQEARLFPWLTVLDNVLFGLAQTEEMIVRARMYLQKVGIEQAERLFPNELSGGMAQRVAIARALVRKTSVLLLDEPFSALDAFTKMKLQRLLLDLWEAERTTMVLVTHDLEEALYLCDRIIVLHGQPGLVKATITIDVLKPRRRDDVILARYKGKLLKLLQLEEEVE